ncbi:MAG: penicillin-binding protein 1C [Bacteroidia bacterium]|nr:penicillin-binding protein 1C [Bacteroidia bacterium]
MGWEWRIKAAAEQIRAAVVPRWNRLAAWVRPWLDRSRQHPWAQAAWTRTAPLRAWAHRRRKVLIPLGGLLLLYLFCLPDPLFTDPVCTVVEDRNGRLLGARIAADGQWRFPARMRAPETFAQALVAFEDKRFWYHPGVDPAALARAVWQNASSGSVVSGGSTLSMQVIRLARKGRDRTVLEKLIEIVLATRLELRYSKQEILGLYASHAPFGGNVVGLDAAAWKYFGREPEALSWAEAAVLAVLPNAPALIHPGRNRDALLSKRNRLLQRLAEEGRLDEMTLQLSVAESLPGEPLPLPSHAYHLLEQVHARRGPAEAEARVRTTVDQAIQLRVNEIVARHYALQQQRGIHNAAVLVADVATGDVLAYAGNTPCQAPEHGCDVDLIRARRSTGSILKPLLYAAMLDAGELLPDMLIADVPSYYSGYAPMNYDLTYGGAVPAWRALARSLNVPAVRMLHSYGIARFQGTLQALGMTTLHRRSEEYGLSLVLGGAEATLWDLGGIYAGMARLLRYFPEYNSRYIPDAFRPLNLYAARSRQPLPASGLRRGETHSLLSAASVWFTLEAMAEASRPDLEEYWRSYAAAGKIAWKTGTSYGYRDAWAIGCTPEYVVAVWMGNADGEGRPGLIGVQAAAPVMFDVFQALPRRIAWFSAPYDELTPVRLCRRSGHQAGDHCPDTYESRIPEPGLRVPPCPYHRVVHLDPAGAFQVHSDCVSPQDMRHEPFFVLPPVQEVYYRNRHPDYRPLPPFREDCVATMAQQADRQRMELIYPRPDSKLYVPVDLDGEAEATVFEAAHSDPEATVFWHLNETFLGETRRFHKVQVRPRPGRQVLTLVDSYGETLVREFEVLEREQ